MFIPLILGTAREGRESEKAAKYLLEEVKKAGINTELIDVRDFLFGSTFGGEQEKYDRLSEVFKRADGFIIVSPEYNHGYPGELKIMLDGFKDEYGRKPIAIAGVSIGGMGGVRMVEQLRLVALELKMTPIPSAVYFSNIGKLFDEKGAITDPSYDERVKKFLDELTWYAKALKAAR